MCEGENVMCENDSELCEGESEIEHIYVYLSKLKVGSLVPC